MEVMRRVIRSAPLFLMGSQTSLSMATPMREAVATAARKARNMFIPRVKV